MNAFRAALLLLAVSPVLLSYSQELVPVYAGESFGAKLANQLAVEGKRIVYYEFAISKAPDGGGSVTYVTVSNEAAQGAAEWDGTKPLPRPVHELVAIASQSVGKDLELVEFNICSCHFNPKVKYASIRFRKDEGDERPYTGNDKFVYLLLDGSPLDLKTIDITTGEALNVMEHGIPRGKARMKP